jgi:dipeptidyl aminopeptidase/acylaminoacyl peptidase
LGKLALILIPLALLAVAACGGADAGPTPSPTATPAPAATQTPAGTPTPPPPPPETVYRFVYREAGATEDVIWRILPSDPSQREELARIPRREGYPIVAALSPDGRQLAYLSQPGHAISEQSSQAEMYLLDLVTGTTTRLAEGVDYTLRPLWTPDSRLIYYRKYSGWDILSADGYINYIWAPREPLPGEPPPTPAPEFFQHEHPEKYVIHAKYSQVLEFIPLGFSEDNRALYFVQVNGGTQGMTLLGSFAPAAADFIIPIIEQVAAEHQRLIEEAYRAAGEAGAPPPEQTPGPPPYPESERKAIIELTDQAAEFFSLSPDRTKVCFQASGIVDGEFVNQVFAADLVRGLVLPIPTEALPPGDQLAPAWYPDSRQITISVPPGEGRPGQLYLAPAFGTDPARLLAVSEEGGFDLPQAWSPDGAYLALVHRTGNSLANPGGARLELLANTGQRFLIGEGEHYADPHTILGWFPVP